MEDKLKRSTGLTGEQLRCGVCVLALTRIGGDGEGKKERDGCYYHTPPSQTQQCLLLMSCRVLSCGSCAANVKRAGQTHGVLCVHSHHPSKTTAFSCLSYSSPPPPPSCAVGERAIFQSAHSTGMLEMASVASSRACEWGARAFV